MDASGRLPSKLSSSSVPGVSLRSDDAPSPAAVQAALSRTREWLLEQQHPDGHWCAELEGDTILESEYVLLLAYLGREDSEEARRAAQYILSQQQPHGGWALYPGGPVEVSASVKAYWALKLTGHSVDSEPMRRARRAILQAGGAEAVNSFTRFYLALLGQIDYSKCPAVPPELVLLPAWCPFNIYEMSSWSRTILVPLSVMWAYRPVRRLPEALGIRELFVEAPERMPLELPSQAVVDPLRAQHWIPWRRVFYALDRGLKTLERLRVRPLRATALRRAEEWILQRLEDSDGLGAIFPPIIWTVVALQCRGHSVDGPIVQSQLRELRKLVLSDERGDRLQPCRSPVWDTAISLIALRDAGVAADDPRIAHAVRWLLDREVRVRGDWSVRRPHLEPGGWFFEYRNAFYPDVDDTAMVLMALDRCLPGRLQVEWLLEDESGRPAADAVLWGQSPEKTADERVRQAAEVVAAMRRGLKWVLGMQSRDGGWAAFDADNDREVFTQVPFADHNAMIDPSTPDITARVLEMFGRLGIPKTHPAVGRALAMLDATQEPDGSWPGRWGVSYLYGTWQVLLGLRAIGVPARDPRVCLAADWLESVQQEDGGWGETPASYDDPGLRGRGPCTASQTAWALMGLIAAGRDRSRSVRRGIRWLIDAQQPDGTWDEPEFTGTGFPRVFYLRYHYYRIYFPLMALARYATAVGAAPADGGAPRWR